jgi:mannose-1-phosphate guanylyltransferase
MHANNRRCRQLKAVILAGGFGTRLRPLSCTRPKALFPIVNKPLLQWIFERLAQNGFKEAILAINMQTEFYIKQQQLPKYGLNVKFSIDPPKTPLGTAGPIKRAEKLVGHEAPFLVLNGDIFADLSYKEMIESHKEGKAVATIALVRVDDPNRYGVAELAEDNRIKNFIEKPPKEKAPSNLINAGVYVLSPRIFDYIPKGKAVSMEREVFPKLAEDGKLYGHPVQGLWMDIGKPEEYLQTNKILADALYKNQKRKTADRFELRKPVSLDKGVIIGEKSVIGPYAVLGKNVTVGKNVVITDSVIFPEAKIGDSASITGAIIGEGAIIGKKVKVGKGCIVADQAKIHEGVQLEEDVAVCPAKEVTEKMLKSKTIR